ATTRQPKVFPERGSGTRRSKVSRFVFLFFFNDPATTEISPLSLHDALPISLRLSRAAPGRRPPLLPRRIRQTLRSEEHTSELQSHSDLVCRLLLEKKKK